MGSLREGGQHGGGLFHSACHARLSILRTFFGTGETAFFSPTLTRPCAVLGTVGVERYAIHGATLLQLPAANNAAFIRRPRYRYWLRHHAPPQPVFPPDPDSSPSLPGILFTCLVLFPRSQSRIAWFLDNMVAATYLSTYLMTRVHLPRFSLAIFLTTLPLRLFALRLLFYLLVGAYLPLATRSLAHSGPRCAVPPPPFVRLCGAIPTYACGHPACLPVYLSP